MRFAFLDRDGVINRFPGKGKYVTGFSEFKILPQALKAIRLLTEAGYELAVISNQGCVSRKLITKKSLADLTKYMLKEIREAGGRSPKVYYCVHQKADNCACKKPKTLLLKKAVGTRKIKRSEICFIGDSEEDMEAAKNFGCRPVLVLSGRSKKKDVPALSVKPDAVHKNLWEAARWLVNQKK